MSDNRITEAELLMLLENGNIDTVTVANLLSMVNKKAILELLDLLKI